MAATPQQTTSVEKVINQCSLHTNLQNYFSVGAVTNEPAITICNRTLQMLLSKRISWKFNRKELAGPERASGNFFVTQYGRQDYRFAGAIAFVLNNNAQSGGSGIDLAASPINNGGTPQASGIVVSGGIATVQTLDTHPFQVGATVFMSGNTNAAFNSTFTMSPTALTSLWSNGWTILTVPDQYHFTFSATSAQIAAGSSGAPGFGTVDTNGNLTGLYAWGWGESGSLQDPNSQSFPQYCVPIKVVRELPPAYVSSGDPLRVAMMQDFSNGVLKFRISYPMSAPYQINLVYQARAPILQKPTDIFPWPDNLAYVLYEVALFMAYRFAKGITALDTKEQFTIATNMIQQAMASEDKEEQEFGQIPEMSLYR